MRRKVQDKMVKAPPVDKAVRPASKKPLQEMTDDELAELEAELPEAVAEERQRRYDIMMALRRRYKEVRTGREGPNATPEEIAAREESWS